MDDVKLTAEKFQMLKCISDLSAKNEFGVASIQELIGAVAARRNITSIAIRKMVWELAQKGLICNPLRGHWRLTDKGKELLKSVMAEAENKS